MKREPSLFEMLAKWEDAQSAGTPLTPEELCEDCPELLPDMRRKIAALQYMDQHFGSVEFAAASTNPSCNANETPSNILVDTVSARSVSETWRNASITLASQLTVGESFASGGLGEVFHAQDRSLGRDVALKVMQSPMEGDSKRRQRFLREAVITGQLEHPGIAPVYAVGQTSHGKLCYAMRFIEGETLAAAADRTNALRTSGKSQDSVLELRRLLSRFVSVCNTIAFAHSHGILHRDIKPANIVLGPYGETFVVDWGLAKRIHENNSVPDDESLNRSTEGDDGQLTQQGMIVGTPAYMSPEQATPLADVNTAADVYGLGATLFYILTSRAPVQESSLALLLERVRQGTIDRPREFNPSVSRQLEAICLKALAPNPDQRYRSALELATDVEAYLADQAVSAMPDTLSQRLARLSRRNRAATQLAAAFLVGLSLITSIFAATMNHQRQIAQQARGQAEQLTIETQRLADEKAKLANQEAEAKQRAEQQSALALDTLRSVILDIQRKLSNVSGAAEVRRNMLQTAINGLDKVSQAVKDRQDVDRQLVIALNDIGSIYLTVGQSTGKEAAREALDCFQKSVSMAQTLAKQNPTDEAQRDLSVGYEKVGEAFWELGQIDEAEAAFRKSFEISEQLNRDGRFDRDLAFGFEKLGDVYIEKGDQDQALAAYERSHKHFLSACERNAENITLQRDVVVSTSKLGNVYLAKGDHLAAEQAYTQCVSRIRQFMNVEDSPFSRRDLSVLLNKLGSVLKAGMKNAEAESSFQESLKLAREHLLDEPNNVQRKRDVTVSLGNLGEFYQSTRNFDEARKAYMESLSIREQSLALNPDSIPAKIDLANTLFQLSETESQAGNAVSAQEKLHSAWKLMEPLQQQLTTAFGKELYAKLEEKMSQSPAK